MATISGEIRDENNDLMADCVVRAYRRDTGALLVAGLSGDGSPEFPGDADYASVSLLLHCDGTDGSTTFTDTSPTPKTITVNGNVHIETDQSKFGGASAYFDGTGDYLTAPLVDSAFFAGDVTVDAFVYPVAHTVDRGWIHLVSGSPPNGLHLHIDATGKLVVDNGTQATTAGTITIPTGQWSHIAVVKRSGSIYGYVDGVQCLTHSAQSYGSTNQINIGRYTGALAQAHGYLDDIRITKGVARYTADFTPPSAVFADADTIPAKPLGEYTLTTAYTGEVQVVALDPDGGTTFNDLILRTTPV